MSRRRRAQGQTGALGGRRRLLVYRPGADANDPPAAGADGLNAPGEPVAGRADDEVAHRADHEEQAEGVSDEPWHADQCPAYEDDQPVEKLPGRHLPATQPLLGVRKHTQADLPDDEGAESADDDEKRERPEEADLVGNEHEDDDLGRNKQKCAKKDHTAG